MAEDSRVYHLPSSGKRLTYRRYTAADTLMAGQCMDLFYFHCPRKYEELLYSAILALSCVVTLEGVDIPFSLQGEQLGLYRHLSVRMSAADVLHYSNKFKEVFNVRYR